MSKIIKTISSISLTILSFFLTIQYSFADLIYKPNLQIPTTPTGKPIYSIYYIIGGLIVVVIVVSVVALLRIRKKHGKK